MAADFNPYHVWLGIPPEDQPANYYRLLGLKLFESNGDVIDSAADRQMSHLRTFQSGKHGDLTQRLLNEVAAARVCLLDPKKRAAYDQQLRVKLSLATAAVPATGAAPPAAGGSAIHRLPPRRPGAFPTVAVAPPLMAPPAASVPVPAVSAVEPQPIDQWDDLLGDPLAKPAHRPGGKSAGAINGNAAKRKANNRGMSIGIAVAVVLIAAVGIGVFALNGSSSDGTLVFDWPLADRTDTTITVDNAPLPAPANGPWEYHGPAGPHHIVAQRMAYKLDANVAVVAGQQQTVPADWKPKATLVLNWPLALRSGAELKIDGRAHPISRHEPLEVAVEPGLHVVQITRAGSAPIVRTATIAPEGRELVGITPLPTSAKLVFDWPADQRKDAELTIDGSKQTVPIGSGNAPFKLVVAPGRRVVHITRMGFQPFDQAIDLAAGTIRSLKPTWTPEHKAAPAVPDTTAPVETAQEPVKKLPIPAAAEQERIAKQLDDLYKTSHPGPKDPAEAQKLYGVAAKAGASSAERYMLLMKGAEIAAAAGDLNLSLQGIDTLDAAYDIDSLEARQRLLDRFVNAGNPDQVADAIPIAEQLIDQAVAADRYDVAIVLATTASHAATRSQIASRKEIEERLSHRRHEIRLVEPIYAFAKKAQETLDKNPADPEANLAVGRWLCFYKNDWPAGLPLLAKGNDEKLKSLAAEELKAPTDAEQQAHLADAWWDLAQKEAGVARDTVLLHAGEIYRSASPNLSSALRKAAIEKRLALVAGLTPMAAKPTPSDEPEPEPIRTGPVGGGGGNPFDDSAPKRSLLVGFDVTKGTPVSFLIITSIRPIFLGPHGSTIPGQLHGKESGPTTQIRAKNGYAVGGIVAQTGLRVDGFKVQFMRIRGTGLDTATSYDSDWFGGGGNGGKKLGGDGRPVIGIFGKCAFALDSIGLIQRPKVAPASPISSNAPAPAKFPLGQWVDVLRLIDTTRDRVDGTWTRKGTELTCGSGSATRIVVPVVIDGGYDFEVEFTGTSGKANANIILPVGSHACMAVIGGWNGAASGLMDVDGRDAMNPGNPIAVRPGTIETGHRYRVLVSVRILSDDRASVDVSLDGKPYLPHWEGNSASLVNNSFWGLPNPKRLGLAAQSAQSSEVTFHSARLRMVSGQASIDGAATGAEVKPASPTTGESPTSLKGKFFLACNGEAELFLNGKLLPLSDSASESVQLSKGDVVALRISSKFTHRTVRAAFLSDDLKWKWPFREADLSVFGDADPTSISPSQFTASLPRAGRGKTKDAIEALWKRLDLPADSEWIWAGGKNVKTTVAALVSPALFMSSTAADHASDRP